MNRVAIRTLYVYALTLLLSIFLNIDRVLVWYGNTGGRVMNETLTAVKHVNSAAGLGPLLDHFECAAGIVFEDSYKDKSWCPGYRAAIQPPPEDLNRNGGDAVVTVRRETESSLGTSSRESVQSSAEQYISESNDFPPAAGTSSPDNDDLPGMPALASAKQEQFAVAAPFAVMAGDRQPAGHTANVFTKDGKDARWRSVLLVGDSLAHDLVLSLNRELKKFDQVKFSYFTKVASGLNNPNVLNWEAAIRTLLKNKTPDLVIVMMGINDANNDIRESGRMLTVGTPEWADAYEEKVRSFLRIASENKVCVYWVGVPVVRDESLQNRVLIANRAAKGACSTQKNCFFIDTVEVLSDENHKYASYRKESNGYSLRIRQKDGIHLSCEGSNLLAQYILPYLSPTGRGS